MAVAVGDVGAHAGNASPDANVATDGAGLELALELAPGLGDVAVPVVGEAGAVAAPGSVDDEGAGVVHADSVRRTATSVAAAGLCKDPSLTVWPPSSPKTVSSSRVYAAVLRRPPWSASRRSAFAEVAPAPGAFDDDPNQRSFLEPMGLVLRVFPSQGGDGRRMVARG